MKKFEFRFKDGTTFVSYKKKTPARTPMKYSSTKEKLKC
jgi:hypothetical protein